MARCALWGWCVWGFSDDSVLKNPSAVQKTRVPSLGWEAPLEEEMATHSRILVWRGQEDYSPWGLKESDTAEQLNTLVLEQKYTLGKNQVVENLVIHFTL